jgi:hypothetical protein
MVDREDDVRLFKKIALTLNGRSYIAVDVEFHSYLDPAGGMAIELVQNGVSPARRVAIATVATPKGYQAAPGCVFLKTYSENEGMLEELVRNGVVKATGRFATGGFDRSIVFPEAQVIGHWSGKMALEKERVRQERIKMLRSEMADIKPY